MDIKPGLSRREILERMAMVTGGAVSLTILSACDNGVSVPKSSEDLALKALSEANFNLVGDIVGTIIPDTDTLGAKSVNVHYLIDELAANWMSGDERMAFVKDLTVLDERIKRERGASFSELNLADRGAVLDQLGAEMLANDNGVKHIYRELRELTIFGYYTSEVGASEELAYDPIPGEFRGCIPFSDVGKTWSI
ncbi:MAG: gluconate 2-dehydrogenase subunit 3 family protein [Kordiimonadaceae bacterium]|jgi:hypothetical protein|nr:gluconate 2-dehydrogenase subunit 3 family protein [Kordiimonadaceae bacterium]MBT6035344.1 gluconate 2-dehydrogenase subunit 3 family protein [Kordiimonadaceae bacterium]MBT6328256.1 gluconate 2-dehydrogenase subunit 3 family protein [Kordiimonadaceae bacterium]